VLHVGKARSYLRVTRFGVWMVVVAVDPAMQREAALLPLLLWEKACQLCDHLHIGVILARFGQLVVYASK
jgi:hypothetical protein